MLLAAETSKSNEEDASVDRFASACTVTVAGLRDDAAWLSKPTAYWTSSTGGMGQAEAWSRCQVSSEKISIVSTSAARCTGIAVYQRASLVEKLERLCEAGAHTL